MKAIRIHEFGGPEVLTLEDIEQLKPAPGFALVRVISASVNPVDLKIREGSFPMINAEQLPVTLGRDLCGVVEAVNGETSGVQIGDEIIALLDWDQGAYAEHALVACRLCSAKPRALDSQLAGSIPLAALTAWQGLFTHGQLRDGQTVLIHGGSGGVGHFAIQLAKNCGARVIATASEANLSFISALGADVVVDYKAARFEDAARAVDVVFDLIGGDTQRRSWKLLKRGGIMVSTLGTPDENTAKSLEVRSAGYMAEPNRQQLDEIAKLIRTGKIAATVTKSFPLAEAALAHRAQADEHPRGKIVLTL